MAEAIVIHTDGRPVLDIDPIELPRVTVYGNDAATDETNSDLHALLNIPDHALDIDMTDLSLVWSDDRHPVMVVCKECGHHVEAWYTLVLDCGEYTSLICGPCDEDGTM